MKIAIAKERRPHERRVAATPDTIKRYLQWGFDVAVESGAGEAASISDDAYRDAGATVAASRAEVFANADIVLITQKCKFPLSRALDVTRPWKSLPKL